MGDLGAGNERLELQYKTLLDLGKFTYDSYFKLAAMSFTLNSLLLTALSFFIGQATKVQEGAYSRIVGLVGGIGLIYNLGALFTFLSLTWLATDITKRFNFVDEKLQVGLRDCRSGWSNRLGSIAVALTAVFFLAWIALWPLLLCYRNELRGAFPLLNN